MGTALLDKRLSEAAPLLSPARRGKQRQAIVYPTRELQQTLDGRPIQLSEAEKSRIIEWAKKGIIAEEIKSAP